VCEKITIRRLFQIRFGKVKIKDLTGIHTIDFTVGLTLKSRRNKGKGRSPAGVGRK